MSPSSKARAQQKAIFAKTKKTKPPKITRQKAIEKAMKDFMPKKKRGK